MRDESPEDFELACGFDERIRDILPRGQAFVHRSLVPLRSVNFDRPSADLFDEDCEGYCGV
jgi:hypothetical protein